MTLDKQNLRIFKSREKITIEKPTIEVVLSYAKFMIDHFVRKKAIDVPLEHKEEMQQEAFERILKSYERIDPSKGWKSFVFNHCRGAVMDYQKFGKGFAEDRWSLQKTSKKRNSSTRINQRLDLDREDQNLTLDGVLMSAGIYESINIDPVYIKWDLVARMASQDEVIHVFAKFLRGFEILELAGFFDLSRSRIFQIIEIFVARFDDPELTDDPWFKQTCYAFGLCRKLGMKDEDQSKNYNMQIGWSFKSIDLDAKEPIKIPEFEQLSFFGEL